MKLSEDNAAKAEAIMRTMYSSSTSLNKKTENSTKSISELKKLLFDKSFDKQEYRRIIAEIVARIDSENSTHLNTDGVGREELTNRILKISHDKLLDYLKKPKSTKYELIRILEKKTQPRDMKHVGRINTSFASKFCHYMCIHLFEGTTYQDNYPIYDSIVRIVLPKYLKHFGIERSITDYESYTKAIDEIIKASGASISRNGFDHILWIYYK